MDEFTIVHTTLETAMRHLEEAQRNRHNRALMLQCLLAAENALDMGRGFLRMMSRDVVQQ